MLVSQRTHDGTDGQAVEIVVDEDQAAQSDNGQLSDHTALDAGDGPLTESSGAAGGVHQLDHGAQNDQEDQNTDVEAVRQVGDDTIIKDMGDRTHEIEVGIHSGANSNTQEQRGINFLGDQGQTDGDYRRQRSPQGVVSEAFALFGGEAGHTQQHDDAQA